MNQMTSHRYPRCPSVSFVVQLLYFLLLILLVAAGCAPAGTVAHTTPPQPAPTATATRPPEPPVRHQPPTPVDLANNVIAHMTLDEELGQLLMVQFDGPNYSPELARMIEQQHVGSVILYGQNIVTPGQVRTLIGTIQAHAAIPVLVATDQEGGSVNRLQPFIGPQPSAQAMGATGDPAVAMNEATLVAHGMHALGINTNLAPDVDVQAAPNTGLPTRMFGSTPDLVTRMAGAYLNALQANGIIGCLKHFPGLGSVTADPEVTLPVVNRSIGQLRAVDLAPYYDLVPDSPGLVMPTDVLVPALDPTLPASLSPAIVTGLLRHEMGYQGVVITDSLTMGGIAQSYSLPQAAVLAVQAGDDILESIPNSANVAAIISALKTAVAHGTITKARIDQSVRRILLLKMRFGIYHPTASARP
jgi:beta-N-acetylhexosaminidase